jgi:Holliday junction resolvase RusA-like endonuclease
MRSDIAEIYAEVKAAETECGMKTRILLRHLPPSVNHLHRHTMRGGKPVTYKTEAYTAWALGEGWDVRRQMAGQPKWAVPVRITAALVRPRSNVDLDNRLKGIGDLLQELEIVANDKLIHAWLVFWSADVAAGWAAEITITGAGP